MRKKRDRKTACCGICAVAHAENMRLLLILRAYMRKLADSERICSRFIVSDANDLQMRPFFLPHMRPIFSRKCDRFRNVFVDATIFEIVYAEVFGRICVHFSHKRFAFCICIFRKYEEGMRPFYATYVCVRDRVADPV